MCDYPFRSIPDMIRSNAETFGDKDAISYKKQGEMVTLSYAHFYERILMASRGLIKAGVKKGDKVAILSENRAGWVIADMGILCAGGVTVPIYATSIPSQVAFVLNHSEAKIVFVSTSGQYEKLLEIRDKIPNVEFVVSFERFMWDKRLPLYTLFQLSEISHPITQDEKAQVESIIEGINSADMMTLIYTSGTTGEPKGAMLSHGNVLFDMFYSEKKVSRVEQSDVLLSFLPLSHVFERTIGYYLTLSKGCHMVFAESIEKVPENMYEVKPTIMVSVPRLFEKIHSRIYETVHQSSALKRKIFQWAVKAGHDYVYARYINKNMTGMISFKKKIADKLVFSKLRKRFGGRIRFMMSGGAPLDKTINEFFWAIGIPILEGYGLTETSPVISVNTFEQLRFGSIGTLIDCTEVKLAEDGELLVRGPEVMQGYYKNPEADKEAFVGDWFKTGDIAKMDEDGFLFIVDRKKELIITAGGKNIPPQPIEREMKLDKYISQAFVCGNKKPYLVALIVPNYERLIDYARQHHIHYLDMHDLVSNDKVHRLYEERIADINKKLARYETIKKFSIVPVDFTVAGGELTPTLKLKRRNIYDKYKTAIERLYDEV